METNKAKLDAAFSHLKSYCGILFVLLSFSLNAQTVNSEKAIEVAKRFYNSTTPQQPALKLAKNTAMTLVKTEVIKYNSQSKLKSAKSLPAYHIINMGENAGFVIVSGDERANPILGYSTNGHFNLLNIPVQLKAFLANYKNEIAAVVKNDPDFKIGTNSKWSELTSAETKSAEVTTESYLVTSQWGQGKNYNADCPEDGRVQAPYGGHVPSGCVSVVISQIMRYWAWPARGTGEYCYTPPSSKNYGQLCANFDTEYNWGQMPDKLSSESSDAEKEAVAKIIYHTAVAVKTDFRYNGSSASSSSAKNALRYYFHYSPKVKLLYKSKFSDYEWKQLLKEQLDNGIPVYYRGDNDGNFGHAFVCDGYDSENRFHFNWGWNGSYDGFFSLNAVTPLSNYNFTFHQGALINLFPDYEDYTVEEASIQKKHITDGENLSLTYKQVYKGYDFKKYNPSYGYYLSTDATLDGNDTLLSENIATLSSKSNKTEKNITINIPESLEYGTYYILISADNKNEFEEIDESNNTVALQFSFSAPATHDFLVENASVAYDKNATVGNSTIQSGESLLLSCRQLYIGNDKTTVDLKSGYFLSTDKDLDKEDVILGEGVSPLSANKKYEDLTLQVTIPEETASGVYYILFVSDFEDEYIETNEENNISSFKVDINNCSDPMEPNNSSDFASFLGKVTDYFQDNLCIQSEDEDWFTFSIESKTFYIKISNEKDSLKGNYGLKINKYEGYFDIETFETTGNTDTKIWLYDKNLKLLAQDDDSGEGYFSILSYDLVAPNSLSLFGSSNLTLYPNPTRGKIYINTTLAEVSDNINITVMDTRGAVIMQKNTQSSTSWSNFSVDLSAYPQGEYIVTLFSNTGIKQSKKIIKQ
ncbi:MAG: T9SS type A sorting domain-containing protein [Chlorobi bacterium]|nr:T9SS type A sorting domain-containing protein [Chlorobiota bacterium]